MGGSGATTSGAGNTITITASQTVNVTSVTSSPYVVLPTDYYLSVSTASSKTIQLPNAPSTGRFIIVTDSTGNAALNNISVTTVGGVVNIDGNPIYTINIGYGSAQFIFNGVSYEVF